MTRSYWGLMCLLALLLVGCGAQAESKFGSTRDAFEGPSAGGESAPTEKSGETANLDAAQRKDVELKIIYTAYISLMVDNLDELDVQLREQVKSLKGYVSNSSVSRANRQYPYGSWTLRIPTTEYKGFIEGLAKYGTVESVQETAEDVTEEYVDLESRLTNQRRLETRLAELLENQTGKLDDVLSVERELARIRGEIERIEGRLRYLGNQVNFSTVTINANERTNFLSPNQQPLGSRVNNAWNQSISSMVFSGKNLLVAGVALIPWLPFILIGLFVLWRIWRWLRSSKLNANTKK